MLREKESKHGMSRTAIYRIWHLMKQRCSNPENTHYASYGGRGITVCERWLDFAVFHQDMGDRPSGMTLERIDNNKGYEPGNVRWASRLDQANNRRTNVLIAFGGRTETIAAWGRETGLGKSTIINRLARGWSVEKALTTTPQHSGKSRERN